MIDILMAVYNGENYVAQQIDSIVAQTVSNWHLVILDDASEDNTADILKRYESRYPDRIEIHRNIKNSGSPQRNFFKLIKYSRHNFVMFSDHDDVWEQNKIEKTYRRMLEIAEISNEAAKPLLVHTDLRVVDDKLNTINDSLMKMQKLSYKRCKLNNLLSQNIVTGCTMMVNRVLLDMIPSFPSKAIMHDWWFALIACCFGKMGFVKEPTILYRQHSDNKVGAKDANSLRYKLSRLFGFKKTKKMMQDTYAQASQFLEVYKDILTPEQKRTIRIYAGIRKRGKLSRVRTLFKYKFFKSGFARKLGQILFV